VDTRFRPHGSRVIQETDRGSTDEKRLPSALGINGALIPYRVSHPLEFKGAVV